ncbi:MAG: hypothetical protein ACRCYQ_03860 [Nocardioides sp.]
MSLTWLARKLTDEAQPVSIATLSYWRSGQRQPEHAHSLEALGTLEDLLRLPAGHLRSLLGPSRRSSPENTTSLDQLLPGNPQIRAALSGLGFGLDPEVDVLSMHCSVDVNAHRRVERIAIRSLWRARRDGVRVVPFVHKLRNPAHGPPPVVETVAGCRRGEDHHDPVSGAYVAQIILDRELAMGETALGEVEVVGVNGVVPEVHYIYGATRRIRESVIWLRFKPGMVPRQVEEFAISGTLDHHLMVTPTHGQTHLVQRSFGPGLLGFRWSWEVGEPLADLPTLKLPRPRSGLS